MRFCIHGILPSIAPRASSWHFLKFLEFFRVVVVVRSQGILGVHGIHEILPICCCGEVDGPSWNSWNSRDSSWKNFAVRRAMGILPCEDAIPMQKDAILMQLSSLISQTCAVATSRPRRRDFSFRSKCRVKFMKFLLS